MPEPRRVVLVGHCGPDVFRLKAAITRAAPGAEIHVAHDENELPEHLSSDSVMLINRVLDGGFSDGSGIELMSQLASADDPPVLILVSNFPDAQAKAEAAGALPGFGKNELDDEATASLLRQAIMG